MRAVVVGTAAAVGICEFTCNREVSIITPAAHTHTMHTQ